MRRILLLIVVLLSGHYSSLCQTSGNFVQDIEFANYLTKNSEYRDAIYFLQSLLDASTPALRADSIHYYLGINYYLRKSLDTSVHHFSQVSTQSPLYINSKYFSVFNLTYTGNYEKAKELLMHSTDKEDSLVQEYNQFQRAAIHLLERDYKSYDHVSSTYFSYTYYPYQSEEKNYDRYRQKLDSVKSKSPLVAALLSTFIPGLGRFYAGRPGQGVSTLFTTLPLAAMATENLLKSGYTSWNFLATGGIFSVFYIGNIWGSALSVKIKRNEQYRKIDEDIKHDLHNSFRRVFQ